MGAKLEIIQRINKIIQGNIFVKQRKIMRFLYFLYICTLKRLVFQGNGVKRYSKNDRKRAKHF